MSRADYAVIYTRRGSPQHERFLDAYIERGKYVFLSGSLYRIMDLAWFDASAGCVRWHVRKVESMACA